MSNKGGETTAAAGAPGSAPFLAAMSGSAVVAVVGLSQILAVGALSVTPLGNAGFAAGVVAAFVAATIGAFFVAVVARAPGEVCGPRTSIAVIYAALCGDLVARSGPGAAVGEIWAALSVAVVLMGLLQVLAGWLRLGDAIKFMPFPVSAGFVTGIGLLVVWSQLGPVLGLEGRLSRYHWTELLDALKPGAAAVALVTALVIWILSRYRSLKRLQPTLVGLAAGTALHHFIAVFHGTEELGPTLGSIVPTATAAANAASLWEHASLSWLLATSAYVLPYSAFFALQAVMNAAVFSVAVSDVTGVRAGVNRTIVAQGLGNVLCGVLAALPVGTSPGQSMVAARMKNVNAIVPGASCLLLLAAVLAAGGSLSDVPVAALAGILVTIGIGLVDRWARGLAGHALRGSSRDSHVIWNLFIVAAVAAAFVLGGVPLALAVGTVLATLLLAVNLSEATTVGNRKESALASTRVWPREQARWLADARRAVAVFRPRGGLFFGTADQLSARLAALPAATKFCVLDLSRLTTLDSTGCQIVAAGARKLAAARITTVLAGLDASRPRERALIALGLTHPDPATCWFADLDHALEWVEMRMIEERWPHLSLDTPVPVSDSPLAKDLSRDELRELRACLQRVDLPAGPLFRSGDPGSSMYVIEDGLVEIRIGEQDDELATRLAAFGPGSIFGEIAMLSSDRRTADAVCIRPTRLCELSRETLLRLEAETPELYARILANLNVHLAGRLVVATSIVQTQKW